VGRDISEIEPTIGVEFNCYMIEHNRNKYKFQIYDTSGLSNFYNITSTYYDTTNIFFIFCDISSHKDNNFLYWYNEVLNFKKKMNTSKDLKIVIIFNKTDLLDNEEKMKKIIKSKYKIDDIYFISSLKDDFSKLDMPFKNLIDYYSKLIEKNIVDEKSIRFYNLRDINLKTPLIEKPIIDEENTKCKCSIL
jgi:small GTP-binding protein